MSSPSTTSAASDTDTSGGASSSRMFSTTAGGSAMPLPPVAFAEMVMAASSASRSLSTAITVTVSVLAVSPAAMFKVRLTPRATGPLGADTTSLTASVDAELKRAPTTLRLLPPLSSMTVGVSVRVAFGKGSSSLMVPIAVAAPVVVSRVALTGVPSATVTFSLGSLIVSSLTRTTMSALVSPAATVTDRGLGVV